MYLLNKYKFSPTKDGPYFVSNKAHTQGKHGEDKSIGGKTIMQKVLQKRTADDQTGDVPADDQQNDSLYLCPVTIGTPGQTFNLDFDTGSADLWLWSTELPKKTVAQNEKEHNIFDHSKSSSFKKIKATWKISYGDGSTASGDVGTGTRSSFILKCGPFKRWKLLLRRASSCINILYRASEHISTRYSGMKRY